MHSPRHVRQQHRRAHRSYHNASAPAPCSLCKVPHPGFKCPLNDPTSEPPGWEPPARGSLAYKLYNTQHLLRHAQQLNAQLLQQLERLTNQPPPQHDWQQAPGEAHNMPDVCLMADSVPDSVDDTLVTAHGQAAPAAHLVPTAAPQQPPAAPAAVPLQPNPSASAQPVPHNAPTNSLPATLTLPQLAALGNSTMRDALAAAPSLLVHSDDGSAPIAVPVANFFVDLSTVSATTRERLLQVHSPLDANANT
jgi:hypothetical protein